MGEEARALSSTSSCPSGKVILVRMTPAGSGPLFRNRLQAESNPRNTPLRATARNRVLPADKLFWTGSSIRASPTQRSSSRKSFAVCQRSSGSFSRHRRTALSSAFDASERSSDTGVGSRSKIAAIKLAWLALVQAFSPVSIS